MRLLDLFCGAGGAAMGYHRAGFEIVGVDLEPHSDFPFRFWQDDALHVLGCVARDGHWQRDTFDAVHASPPCQAYSTMGQRYATTQAEHPALISETRRMLEATDLPYVIENVQGARRELERPITLCGRALGCGVRRHRLFECSFDCPSTPCACRGDELPVYGKLDGRRVWTRADGSELRAAGTLKEAREAMGVDWMGWDDLKEAIPPAYTEHVGRHLMAHLLEPMPLDLLDGAA